MAKKYYLAMAVGTAAVMLISAGPLAAHNCAQPEMHSRAEQSRAQPTVFADKNRDGKVTRAEAKVDPALARSFDRYDADDDNILNQAEFARLEAESTPSMASAQSIESGDEGVDMTDSDDDRLRPRQVVHPTSR